MNQRITDLQPGEHSDDTAGWQARKSAQTRTVILEAAIDCLADHGYARTTTQLIAQTARISRGAMLHHYATKQDLIANVIDYTFSKRTEQFSTQIGELSEKERVEDQAGLELVWQSFQSREYTAYLELSVAARTDEELRAIFDPKAREFDQAWFSKMIDLFPEWHDRQDRLQLATDFSHAVMEGLLINKRVWTHQERRQAVRNMLTHAILMLRDQDD